MPSHTRKASPTTCYLFLAMLTVLCHVPCYASQKQCTKYEKKAQQAIKKCKYSRAVNFYQQAIGIADTLVGSCYNAKYIELYYQLAFAHHANGDVANALQVLQKINFFQRESLPPNAIELGINYKQIADRYLESDDPEKFAKASDAYQKAIHILTIPSHEAEGAATLAACYGGLAYIATEQRQHATAIDHYTKALRVLQKYPHQAQHPPVGHFYYLIARQYLLTGNYPICARYAHLAFDAIPQKAHKKDIQTASYASLLSVAYFKQGNLQEATTYQEKAYEVRKKILGRKAPLTLQTLALLETIKTTQPFPSQPLPNPIPDTPPKPEQPPQSLASDTPPKSNESPRHPVRDVPTKTDEQTPAQPMLETSNPAPRAPSKPTVSDPTLPNISHTSALGAAALGSALLMKNNSLRSNKRTRVKEDLNTNEDEERRKSRKRREASPHTSHPLDITS